MRGRRREIGVYLDALKAAGKDPARYSIVNSRAVYVADCEEESWARHPRRPDVSGRVVRQMAPDRGRQAADRGKVLIRPDADRLRRTTVLGSASEVATRLEEVLDSTPITELVVVMQLPGLDPTKARRSLDRFDAEVLPRLK